MDPSELPDRHLCWSCQKEFGNGGGVSIDESGEEQICLDCWNHVPVTSRMVLGLLFRRIEHGGGGIRNLIEDALAAWPYMGQTRPPSRN